MHKGPCYSKKYLNRGYVDSEGQGRMSSLGVPMAGTVTLPSSRQTLQGPQSQAVPSLGLLVFLPIPILTCSCTFPFNSPVPRSLFPCPYQAAHTRALTTPRPAPLPVGSAVWDGVGRGRGKSVCSGPLFCFHDPVRS